MTARIFYIVGACLAALGIVCLLSVYGPLQSTADIPVGSAIFSLGTLFLALGFYFQSAELRSQYQVAVVKEKKTDRLCSVCNRESAQVFCRVHVLRLCLSCLEQHDDNRNCLYVPAKRASAAYK